MIFEFYAEIFGVNMDIVGSFEDGEPATKDEPAIAPEFIIESVLHCGNELEWEAFPAKELDFICEESFKKFEIQKKLNTPF